MDIGHMRDLSEVPEFADSVVCLPCYVTRKLHPLDWEPLKYCYRKMSGSPFEKTNRKAPSRYAGWRGLRERSLYLYWVCLYPEAQEYFFATLLLLQNTSAQFLTFVLRSMSQLLRLLQI
jgi:hypothetical protein